MNSALNLHTPEPEPPHDPDGPPPQAGGAAAPPDEAEPTQGERPADDTFFVDDEEAEEGPAEGSVEDSVFCDPTEGEPSLRAGGRRPYPSRSIPPDLERL